VESVAPLRSDTVIAELRSGTVRAVDAVLRLGTVLAVEAIFRGVGIEGEVAVLDPCRIVAVVAVLGLMEGEGTVRDDVSQREELFEERIMVVEVSSQRRRIPSIAVPPVILHHREGDIRSEAGEDGFAGDGRWSLVDEDLIAESESALEAAAWAEGGRRDQFFLP